MKSTKIIYKLGEELANGVMYFGQDSKDNHGERTAIFVCPKCGGKWRAPVSKIKNGSIKSCCERGFKKKQTTKEKIDKECIKIRYNGHNYDAIQSLLLNIIEVRKTDKEKFLIIPTLSLRKEDEVIVKVGEYIYYSKRNGVHTK